MPLPPSVQARRAGSWTCPPRDVQRWTQPTSLASPTARSSSIHVTNPDKTSGARGHHSVSGEVRSEPLTAIMEGQTNRPFWAGHQASQPLAALQALGTAMELSRHPVQSIRICAASSLDVIAFQRGAAHGPVVALERGASVQGGVLSCGGGRMAFAPTFIRPRGSRTEKSFESTNSKPSVSPSGLTASSFSSSRISRLEARAGVGSPAYAMAVARTSSRPSRPACPMKDGQRSDRGRSEPTPSSPGPGQSTRTPIELALRSARLNRDTRSCRTK
jgi:hypothetical protein